ncbi:MAG: GNAT family N-acetyltransferase, partial [Anaerolineaceae bacterium]|nr:GNAT family N-acetyltransferase [Anaerolineaceae bacterium]
MAELRAMTVDDVADGLELCREAGWNQVAADWRRLLDLEPGGVFVAEEAGWLCATASVISYGTRTGWIGMLMVHPDYRRRGIASALMARCIQAL